MQGKLTVRMRLSRAFEANRPLDAVKKDLDEIAADPLFREGSERLRVIGNESKSFVESMVVRVVDCAYERET